MKRILKQLFGKLSGRIIFLGLGLASTIWFLIRVIPKPSRAGYPCMRAAAPIMSAFILYLLSITSSVVFFRKFKQKLLQKKYYSAFGFIAITVALIYFAGTGFNSDASARDIKMVGPSAYTPNDPVGVPKGLHPGRVVWVWDNEATDETCTNTSGNWWFGNTDQAIVDTMMQLGILNYAGAEDLNEAWDAIFKHFNSNHGKGEVGYTAGEKIYVKINITNSCCSVSGTAKYKDYERMDATPEVVLSLLKQLVEVVGVAQSDIYLGDPFRTFHDLYFNLCYPVYPDVNYCDGQGINGRHKTVPTADDIMKFSDGRYDWRIPQEYVDAAYLINMPCLKTHDSNGITLAAKNHQGSVLQDGADAGSQSAFDMHYSLPDHDNSDGGPHRYRHLVDYIGHEQLGGKTLFIIVDGIWAGKSWEGWVEKWDMAPFNTDYPSSLFFSQDHIALESVCWDFLLTEYADKPADEQYPYYEGTEDYIRQAADPEYWPEDFSYDPEGDGSVLGSMGVYEHWNNETDMSYTSIDFVKVFVEHSGEPEPEDLQTRTTNALNVYAYPNPASDQLTIEYSLSEPSAVSIELFDLRGSRKQMLHEEQQYTGSQQFIMHVNGIIPGFYLIEVKAESEGRMVRMTKKIQIL